MERVVTLASQRAVVIFSHSSCYLTYTVRVLLQELGVQPLVYEIDRDPQGRAMERALMRMMVGFESALPSVFIGGKLVGSTNEVMTLHVRGQLIPLLRQHVF